MAPRRLLLVLLLFALGACAAPLPQSCGIRPYAEVPVRVVNRTPLVEAQINGQPVTLLLDTGAASILLTQDAVRRLGLALDLRRPMPVRGVGGATTTAGTRVRDLTLAGIDVPDHTVAMLPYAISSQTSERIDGLFGMSVMRAFDIDLDLARGRMTLYGGLVCGDTAIPAWREPHAGIPAELAANGWITVEMRVGRQPLRALLDTGATRSLIATEVLLAAGVARADLERATPATVTGVGPERVAARVVQAREIAIGPERFPQIGLIVADRPAAGIDAILGMDYLGARRLWLSNARRQVFIMIRPPA